MTNQPQAAERSQRSVIAYLAFLGVLLATGIDIALPAFDSIEEGLDTAGNVPLVITTYLVGMAIGQLFWGPIADRYGRRPAILAGLALYSVGAVASALAPSFGVLLIARFAWGLGGAAAAGLRPAIARDLYRGDQMARVTTIMMAVFLLGPVFMPLIGEFLIRLAPWRSVFWFSAALAVIGIVWCARFGETLSDQNERRLDFGELRDGVMAVARSRVTVGHLLANVFFSGAFFIFLGSAQPVFDQVYDRSSQFAFFFALTGVLAIPPLLINNQLIDRFGSRTMCRLVAAVSVALSVGALVPTLAADGRPSFWLWYGWLVVTAAGLTVSTPMLTAMALEPMGELAGTASSLMYFSGFAFGAVLAAIFDAQVSTTVTPFILGFAIYTSVGYGFLWWAGAIPANDGVTTS